MTREQAVPLTAEEEATFRAMLASGDFDYDTLSSLGFSAAIVIQRFLATLDHERRMADTEVKALRDGLDAALAADMIEPGLTEAWAAAEAALPEQGRIAVQGREEGQYEAWAQARQESGFRGLGFGYGPTPAAALTALAAALRSHTDG